MTYHLNVSWLRMRSQQTLVPTWCHKWVAQMVACDEGLWRQFYEQQKWFIVLPEIAPRDARAGWFFLASFPNAVAIQPAGYRMARKCEKLLCRWSDFLWCIHFVFQGFLKTSGEHGLQPQAVFMNAGFDRLQPAFMNTVASWNVCRDNVGVFCETNCSFTCKTTFSFGWCPFGWYLVHDWNCVIFGLLKGGFLVWNRPL